MWTGSIENSVGEALTSGGTFSSGLAGSSFFSIAKYSKSYTASLFFAMIIVIVLVFL